MLNKIFWNVMNVMNDGILKLATVHNTGSIQGREQYQISHWLRHMMDR
jgi:hypothetical protein